MLAWFMFLYKLISTHLYECQLNVFSGKPQLKKTKSILFLSSLAERLKILQLPLIEFCPLGT